jgi:hypothetical protein
MESHNPFMFQSPPTRPYTNDFGKFGEEKTPAPPGHPSCFVQSLDVRLRTRTWPMFEGTQVDFC